MADERILVVDDEPEIVELCTRLLTRQGHAVRGVTSGREAITCLEVESFDLLVIDIKMPDVDGLAVLRQVRELDPNLTAVVISGYATLESAVEAIHAGARGFVLKPFGFEELIVAVNEALEQRRKEHERLRLRAQLPILEIAQALVTEGDINSMAGQLLETVARQLGADRALLLLLDEKTEELTIAAAVGLPADRMDTARVSSRQGIARRILLGEETLILDRETGLEPPLQTLMARPDAAGAVWVPLRTGKKAVGVLNLSRSAGSAPFTPSDLNLLSIVSAQIATALENARLFEETERLKAFNESIVQGVAEAILIEDAQGIITFVNPALEALLGRNRQELVGRHWSVTIPADQIERVREQTAQRPQGIESRYETGLLDKSGQAIPVIVSARPLFEEGEFAGVLAAFTDITERVRAEEELRRRNAEMAALNTITTAASQSLDLREVLEAALEETLKVLDAEGGLIYLFDEASQAFAPVVHHGISPDVLQEVTGFKMGEGLSGKVAESGEALVVADPGADPRNIIQAAVRWGWRSYAGMPIKCKGKVLGVMSLVTGQEGHFKSSHVELLNHIGHQVGVAVENARLYEQSQARSRYLETLQQINATLRSTLPLDEVLATIARGAGEALGHVGSLIVVPDSGGERLILGAMWGGRFLDAAVKFTGLEVRAFGLPVTATENPMARAYLSGEIQSWTGEAERIVVGVEPAINPKLAPLIARAMGAKGAACIPLPVSEKVVGVLVVFPAREQLTDEERAILLGLANQAGLAIENARLYQAARREVAERVRAEEALRISEARFRALIENSGDMIILLDSDGTMRYTSPSVQRIMGYASDEMVGRNVFELIHPEDLARVRDETLRVMQNPEGSPATTEARVRHADGSWHIHEGTGNNLLRDPAVMAFVMNSRDITERKRAEEALRETQGFLTSLLEHAPISIYVASTDGRLRLVNRFWEEFERLKREEVVGRRLEQIFPAEVARQYLEMNRRAIDTAAPVVTEEMDDTLDGRHYFHTVKFPLYGATGEIEAVGGVSIDITERKRAEQQIAMFKALAENAVDAISMTDLEGRITYGNHAFYELLGYDYEQGDLIGIPLASFTPEEQLSRQQEALSQVMTAGRWSGEGLLRRKDGSSFDAYLSVFLVLGADGRPISTAAIIRDITEQKRAEEVLKLRVEEALELRMEQLTALSRASQVVTASLELGQGLAEIETLANEALASDYTSVVLVDEAGQVNQSAKNLPGLPAIEYRIREEGLTHWIVHSRQTVIVDEIGEDGSMHPEPGEGVPRLANPPLVEAGVQSIAGLPLIVKERLLGVLYLHSRRPGAFRDQLPLLTIFANQVATAIENTRLYEETRQRADQLSALNIIGQAITSSLDLRETLTVITDYTTRLLDAAAASVILRDEAKGDLWFAASSGESSEFVRATRLAMGQGVVGWVIEHGGPALVPDVSQDPRFFSGFDQVSGFTTRSILCVPLRTKDQIIGAIEVMNKADAPFGPEDLQLLTSLAAPAATAIENARLFEEVWAGRERLQALSHRLVEVQEAERRHIARELHDEVGQVLTGLKLSLEMSTHLPDEAVKASLDEAQALVNELMVEVRDLSLDLRPAMLDDLGLLPALLWHFERYTAQTQVHVVFKQIGLERRFRPEIETAVYRMVQEALTNVARHAGASKATVRLWADDETMGVQIEDQGAGFDLEAALSTGTSSGLAGMHERVALLGGQLTIETAPGTGTRLTAELPLSGPGERGGDKHDDHHRGG